jgi:beta-aspartyl-peptidase (threonine type)
MRGVTAYDVSARMKYGGVSLTEAGQQSVDVLTELKGEGGLIAVDAMGDVTLPFNSEGMYRGYITEENEFTVEIFR